MALRLKQVRLLDSDGLRYFRGTALTYPKLLLNARELRFQLVPNFNFGSDQMAWVGLSDCATTL